MPEAFRLRRLHPVGGERSKITYCLGSDFMRVNDLGDSLSQADLALLDTQTQPTKDKRARALLRAVRRRGILGHAEQFLTLLIPENESSICWSEEGQWQIFAVQPMDELEAPGVVRPPQGYPPIFPFALAELEPNFDTELGHIVGPWHTVGNSAQSLFGETPFVTEIDPDVPAQVQRLFDQLRDQDINGVFSYLAAAWEPALGSWRICCLLETIQH